MGSREAGREEAFQPRVTVVDVSHAVQHDPRREERVKAG